MDNYWIPQLVTNPEIKTDIYSLYPSLSDENIEQLLSIDELNTLFTGIVDRIEFLNKLNSLYKIIISKRTFEDSKLTRIFIENQWCLEFTRLEKVNLEGYEFNGVNYDIEALRLYLQTTVIEHISSKIINSNNASYDFLDWLKKNNDKETYSLDDIENKYKKHREITGVRRQFINGFNLFSVELKDRFIEKLLVAKVDLGKMEASSLVRWEQNSSDQKLEKIAKYLYDEIRCSYTHNMIRTFSNSRKVTESKPIKRKLLVLKGGILDDTLPQILDTAIIELFRVLCDTKLSTILETEN